MQLHEGRTWHELQAPMLSPNSPLIALCAVRDTVSRTMEGELSGGVSGMADNRRRLADPDWCREYSAGECAAVVAQQVLTYP
jgi:hypothetical protein